jgi:ornithine cyclodeaminase/alanine dehydrogenase-like protein (mu-crystallin family)
MNQTLFLSSNDITRIIQRTGPDALMDTLIDRLEKAFQSSSDGSWEIPARDGFHYEAPYPGLIEWMPLMHRGDSVMMKLVGYHPNNPSQHQLPTILSTLALFDVTTGQLKVMADGTLLTALRTGAASAVASRVLANPESRTLGLIGAGAQAMSQLHAISRLFPLKRVLVHDIDRTIAESFEDRISVLNFGNLECETVPANQLVAESDIICTATSVEINGGPVFSNSAATKPHLHINAVGSDLPGKTEVPLNHLQQSFVCPDFSAQAIVEGECQQLKQDEIGPELSEVLNSPSRFAHLSSKLTVFDSTGFALEDFVALEYALEVAKQIGVGLPLQMESGQGDPHNPYEFLSHSQVKQVSIPETAESAFG